MPARLGLDRLRPLIQTAFASPTVRGSSFMMAGSWLATGISLVQSVIVTRGLGGDSYGLLILAIALVSFVVNFLDLHTSEVLVKLVGSAMARGDKAEAVALFHVGLLADMLLALVSLLAAWFVVPLLITLRGGADQALLNELTTIFIFTIPFSTLQSTFISALLIYKKFGLYAALGLVNSLVLITATVALLPYGTVAVMFGYLIASIVGFGLYVGVSLRLLMQDLDIWRGSQYARAWRQFLPFVFHTSVVTSLKTLFANTDILLLGMLRPPAEVTYYKIATSAASLIAIPVSPITTVIFPAMNEAWTHNNLAEVKRLIRRFLLYSVTVSLSGVFFFAIAARWLVVGIYGPNYIPVVLLIHILALAYLVGNLLLWVRPATLSAGQPQLLTFITSLSSILRVAMAVPLVLVWGAAGVAVAFLFTSMVSGLVSILYIAPRLGLSKPDLGEAPTV